MLPDFEKPRPVVAPHIGKVCHCTNGHLDPWEENGPVSAVFQMEPSSGNEASVLVPIQDLYCLGRRMLVDQLWGICVKVGNLSAIK